MSWENLAHLTRPLEMTDSQVKGTGKNVARVVTPGAVERLRPIHVETASGGPTTAATPEINAFTTRQAAMIRRVQVDPNLRTRPWVVDAMTNSKENLDTFLEKLIAQIRKGVNEQSLTEAHAVLNEISKTPDGAAAVRRHVTPDNLRLAISMSKGTTPRLPGGINLTGGKV